MTDKELAQRLTGALDERIARASAAPVVRERMNHMPSADVLTSPQVKAIPVKQLRWKNAIAAVLVVGMLGGIGLGASKLLNRSRHAQTGESGNNPVVQTTEAATQNAEPLPDAELPVVSFEEDTKTLRVVGTGNYDRIDLSRLPEAANMIVEDDDFEYRILPTVLFGKDSPIEDPVSYLPGYLEHVDQSLAAIRKFVTDNSTNENVIAQTQKHVKLSLNAFGSNNINNSYTIDIVTGGAFRLVGTHYTLGLLYSSQFNRDWKYVVYSTWVDLYNNPYCQMLFEDHSEYYEACFYAPYFQQAGGSWDLRDRNNTVLLYDVISWCNLVFGRDWGGGTDETGHLSDMLPSLGAAKEGSNLSLSEALSFMEYLAEHYGADKVTAYCFDACAMGYGESLSFEAAFGTDFAAAKAAWEQSLIERFGDGSEEPAELPQVSYDADSRTVRITGTTGYDRLDLSSYMDNAMSLEVEDDRFQFSTYVALLANRFDDPAAELPAYLNRLDRSIDFIANYISDAAPNEEIAAQTRKPVKITMQANAKSYSNNTEDITLFLGSAFKRHGVIYTSALLNPACVTWYQLGYIYWVSFCLDPYNTLYVGVTFEDAREYTYYKDYFRMGGTGDPTPENFTLLNDANAWYNLVHGRDWGGSETECGHINEDSSFNGDPNLEGNDLGVAEAVSLINYLAEQYGEKQVAAFCFDTCTLEEAFGTDFATARAAWEQSLLDRFGDGSENP